MIIITFFVLYCNPFSCIKYNFIAFYRFFFVQISHLGLLSYFICRHFLHKNAISFRWIVNKHMGHGTNNFPSCRIGLPESPCTIPPVSFSRFSSST